MKKWGSIIASFLALTACKGSQADSKESLAEAIEKHPGIEHCVKLVRYDGNGKSVTTLEDNALGSNHGSYYLLNNLSGAGLVTRTHKNQDGWNTTYIPNAEYDKYFVVANESVYGERLYFCPGEISVEIDNFVVTGESGKSASVAYHWKVVNMPEGVKGLFDEGRLIVNEPQNPNVEQRMEVSEFKFEGSSSMSLIYSDNGWVPANSL